MTLDSSMARFGRLLPVVSLAVISCVCGLAGSARSDSRGDPRLRKGTYITSVSETTVDLRFEVADPALALTLDVSAAGTDDTSVAHRVFESRQGTEVRVVRVAGLRAATRYAYALRVRNIAIATGHFATPSDAETNVTFHVYGDNRSDPVAHGAVVRAMSQLASDFLVNTGDVVEDGASPQDWQSFFDIEAPLLRDQAIFVAVGNHELHDDNAGANFAKYFGFLGRGGGIPTLYGTVRYGSVRFFFLNGMHDWNSGDERDWLVRELTRADDEPGVIWRIAVAHQGPFSAGPHGPNVQFVSAGIAGLLAAHRVDLFLSGHDHIYDRGQSDKLKYVVSGGGGAPLYRVQANDPTARKTESTYHFVEVKASASALRLVAHRVDGTVLDQCGFAKGGSWDCDSPALTVADASSAGFLAEAAADHSAARTARCGCAVRGAPTQAGVASVRGLAALGLVGGLVARGARGRRSAVRARGARL